MFGISDVPKRKEEEEEEEEEHLLEAPRLVKKDQRLFYLALVTSLLFNVLLAFILLLSPRACKEPAARASFEDGFGTDLGAYMYLWKQALILYFEYRELTLSRTYQEQDRVGQEGVLRWYPFESGGRIRRRHRRT